MDKKQQINIWYIVAAIALWLAFQAWYTTWRSVEPIPYSQFSQLLKDGKVTDIEVGPEQIVGKFKEALPDGRTVFVTNRVDPALADELSGYGVTYNGTVENTFLTTVLS